jgi:hypothetical protein
MDGFYGFNVKQRHWAPGHSSRAASQRETFPRGEEGRAFMLLFACFIISGWYLLTMSVSRTP